MQADSFKTNVAAALVKSILLWRDALPETRFPSTRELVQVELGRILGHREIARLVPGMRAVIGPTLAAKLMDEPWDVDPPAMLEAYIHSIGRDAPLLERAGNAILDVSHLDGTCGTHGMLMRSGKPATATHADHTKYAAEVARVLGLASSKRDEILSKSIDAYNAVHMQLRVRL
jgi:hypothetical protein